MSVRRYLDSPITMTSTTSNGPLPGQGDAEAIALHLGDRYEIVERLSDSDHQAVYRGISRATG